jgi:2-keto-4-pentenoate hydratase/2-oxohepta-3-ene-1,7-dioic acid hydratase in catechol pathway
LYWQKYGDGGQWVRGKSFDTFCPLGPELVTKDLISDPQQLRLQCFLNSELMQDANTSDMIFSVAELIEYLSDSMALLPGTVIMSGTPSGVGFARNPGCVQYSVSLLLSFSYHIKALVLYPVFLQKRLPTERLSVTSFGSA